MHLWMTMHLIFPFIFSLVVPWWPFQRVACADDPMDTEEASEGDQPPGTPRPLIGQGRAVKWVLARSSYRSLLPPNHNQELDFAQQQSLEKKHHALNSTHLQAACLFYA